MARNHGSLHHGVVVCTIRIIANCDLQPSCGRTRKRQPPMHHVATPCCIQVEKVPRHSIDGAPWCLMAFKSCRCLPVATCPKAQTLQSLLLAAQSPGWANCFVGGWQAKGTVQDSATKLLHRDSNGGGTCLQQSGSPLRLKSRREIFLRPLNRRRANSRRREPITYTRPVRDCRSSCCFFQFFLRSSSLARVCDAAFPLKAENTVLQPRVTCAPWQDEVQPMQPRSMPCNHAAYHATRSIQPV